MPSCDWLKNKVGLNKKEEVTITSAARGDVLAVMNGKPLVTVNEFEKQFKSMIENHPYGAMLAQMEGLERQVLEGMVAQKLINEYITTQGIDKTPEYKQQFEALTQMLNSRFFQMKHMPKATESEMKEFYEQNKQNLPETIMSRGGINATGVLFATEADAKAFLEKAKGKGAQLEKLAKDANLNDKYRDFKLVNATSPIEPALREKIVNYNKFPTLEVVKVDNKTYYVVFASGKEEQKYRSYDEVKSSIEQRVAAKKQEEALKKAVEQLKSDYNVTVNEEYFTKKDAAKKAEQKEPENDEQLEMVMPETQNEEKAKTPSSPKAA